MLYAPKIIPIGNHLAITGERHLAFVPVGVAREVVDGALSEAARTFAERGSEGLPFRADESTLSVTIIPTMACNLRCSYCYSDGGDSSLNLNTDFAYRVIDSLVARYPATERINLFFAGGGEPLIKQDVMSAIVDHVRTLGLAPAIRLVTNGTLVGAHLSWLRENRVYLRISYDGSAQSSQRPGCRFDSAVRLQETFNLLQDSYPADLVSVQMTVTKENVHTIKDDVVVLAHERGVRTFKIEPVQSSCSDRSRIVPSPDPAIFADSVLRTLDRLLVLEVQAFLDLSYLSIPSTEYFCSLRNKIVISPYGVLGPCVELIRPGVIDNLLLWKADGQGQLDFDEIQERQKTGLQRYHPKNYAVCSNCNLAHICKGNCPMRLILAGRTEGPFGYNCSVAKALIPAFLRRACKQEAYMKLVFGDSFTQSEECF